MQKILITGGRGFLGSRFKKMWKHKYEILNPGSKELNITDKDKVREYIISEKPQYVIHAAGIPNQKFCIENPELAQKVNVEGAIYVAEACKEVNAKLIFISTEQVFNGNVENGPYTEYTETVPDTVYGKNKLEVESRLSEVFNDYWVLRFTWLFGLPESNCALGPNILWDTINSLIHNEKIYANAYEFRGMSDVNEICLNIEKVFSIPYGTYHFGSINNNSRYEIVKYIMQLLKLDDEKINSILIEENGKYSKENIRDLRLDTSKLAEQGIVFKETKEAIKNCLLNFGIIKE